MNSRCWSIAAIASAALASGCDWGGASFSVGGSVSRNNGTTTVSVDGGPVVDGSGTTAKETRPARSFRNVAAHQGIQVTIAEGAGDSVTVEADDNLLRLVETSVENDTLQVRIIGNLTTDNPIQVSASATDLAELTATSSASITAKRARDARVRVRAESSGQVSIDEADGDQLELSASSSGQVAVAKAAGKSLRISVDSSGQVTAAGEVDEQQVTANSSGQYNGEKLASSTASVECNSAGQATVQASDEVTGAATSAGQVRYVGQPARVSIETHSAGSVSKAG